MVQHNLNTFTLTLINTTGQTLETLSIPLNSTNPIPIQIGKGTIIRLQDDETGLGPKRIVAKRVGDDLHIYFEDGDELVDVIVEGYYLNPELFDIQGEVTEGEWVSYFPEEGDAASVIAQLEDGNLSGQILQGDFESAFSPLTLLGLAGLVGAGVIIASNSDSNDSNGSVSTQQNPTGVIFSENTNANDREISLGKSNSPIDTNDATPILKGTTTPGATIEIVIKDNDGNPIKVDDGTGTEIDLVYTTKAGPDGTWEIEIGNPNTHVTGPTLALPGLPDGDYQFEIKQKFPDGSTDNKTVDVAVDTVNPISTTFSITDNDVSSDYLITDTPLIQAFGLSDEGGTLIISLPETQTAILSARTSNPSIEIEFKKDGNGVWSVDFSDQATRNLFEEAFPEGFSGDTSYSFTIKDNQATDQEITFRGKVVDGSNIKNITVDLNAPKKDQVQGNLIIDDTTKPALTNDDTPKLTGSVKLGNGEEIGYINITVTPLNKDGVVIGKDITIMVPGSQVDPSTGKWEYFWDENNPLPNGIYNFKTVVVDKAGNEGKTEEHKIEIKSIRPQPIDIDSIKVGDDVGTRQEDNVLDDRYLGNQTDDSKPTISGEAEVGNDVIVKIKKPDGTVVLESPEIRVSDTDADDKGEWSFTPDIELPPGEYIIEVLQKNPLDPEYRPSPPINIEITVGEDSPLAGVNPKDVSVKDDQGLLQEGNILDNSHLGNATDDSKPTFSGQLKPEDTNYPGTTDHIVEITLKKPDGTIAKDDKGNNLIFKVPVDREGNWEFTPINPIPDGDYKVEMVEKDAGGKSSPKSDFPLTIDTKVDAPIFKVVDDVEGITGTILNNGVTNDISPTLSGKAEPNADITIVIKDKDGNESSVITKADANGNWKVDAELESGDGKYTLSVTQTDAAGNKSQPKDHIINLNTEAPAKVTDIKVKDDIGDRTENNVLDNTYQGNATDDNKPTISGKGEPGGSVTITVTDLATGDIVANYPNIPVDKDGNWLYTPEQMLKDGNFEFSIKQTGPNGVASDDEKFQLKIDTDGNSVSDMKVSDNENPRLENNILDNAFIGESTDDKTPTISGSGKPGNIIELIIQPKTPGQLEIKVSVPVDTDGKWTYTPPEPGLSDGEYTIIAKERDQATGATGPATEVDISIDTSVPPALMKPKVEDNQLSITEDNILDNTLPGEVTDDTTPTLKGQSGVPNGEVNITFKNTDTDETFTGKANIDNNGNWQFTPSPELPDGDYEVTINQSGQNGKPGPDTQFGFKIDTNSPTDPVTDIKIGDDIGPRTEDNILTDESSGGYLGNITDDTNPTFSGKTDPENGVLIVIKPTDPTKPPVIYNVPKTDIGEDGNWAFTPPVALPDGDYKVEIFPTKPETGAKGPVTEVDLTIDTTIPPKLEGFKVGDDVGSREEDDVLSNPPTEGSFIGNATDDNQPTISGDDAVAGGEVEVTLKRDGQPDIVVTVPVDSDGKWSYTPESPLDDGDYTIELKQIGPNGKPSEPESFPLVIDTAKPGDVTDLTLVDNVDARVEGNVFDDTYAGNSTNDITPTLRGKGTPGDLVEITVVKIDPETGTETVLETKEVTIDENGNWQFENTTPFVDGDYQYQITPINPNTGVKGNTIEKDFTIDTSNGGLTDIKLEDDVNWIGKDGVPKESETIPSGNAPLLEGKGKPNETITIEVTDDEGNTQHLETKVDPDGNWKLDLATNPPVKEGGTFTPPTGGDYTVNVVPTPPSAIYPTIIDGFTNDNNPTISGKSDPDADIEIKVLDKNGNVVLDDTGNDVVVMGKADENGDFSINPGQLPDGEYKFEITSKDPAGNQSPPVTTAPIIIDTIKPGNVTFTVNDDKTDEIKLNDSDPNTDGTGLIIKGDRTNDKRPEIKGSGAEPGNTINVLVMDKDGNLLEPDLSGKAIVDAEGNWSYLIPVMRDGDYQIVTTQTDKAGNTSDVDEDAKINFSVNADLFYPSNIEYSDSVFGDISSSTTPTISGLGKPGDVITVAVNNPDGTVAFTQETTVGEDGKWSVTSPSTLSPTTDFDKPYQVYVTGKNEWGDELVVPPLDLIIDNSPPAIGITVNNISNAQFDDATNIFGTNDKTLIFYGTIDRPLDKHETMEVFLQGGWRKINPEDIILGEDGKYHWSYDNSNQPFALATYNLRVRVIDAFGRVSEMPNPPKFAISAPAYAQKPTFDLVIEEDIEQDSTPIKGVNKESMTSDSTPILSGTGVPGDTIKIYVDGKFTGETTTVGSDGKWKHELSQALGDGKHTLSVSAVNNGSESAPTDNYEIVVDTTAPTATVTLDNISANTGEDASVTDDNTLYFFLNVEGELARGEKVQIKIGDNDWVDASQLPDGRWVYDNTAVELPDGEYDIKTRVIDKFGRVNESDNTTIGGADEGYTFKIDTTQANQIDPNLKITSVDADAPDRESIINDNLYLNDNTPTIIGEGTPGDIIVIYSNGIEIGTTTVYEDGMWEFNMPYQTDGAYVVSVASGKANELGELDKSTLSRPTNSEQYVVDTTPPNVMVNMTGISVDSGDAGNRRTSDESLILYGQISQALKEGESLQIRLWQNSASIFNGSAYVVDPNLKIALDTGWITVKAEDVDNGTLKWVFDFANSDYAKSQAAIDQGIIDGKLPLADGDKNLGTGASNGKPQINIEFRVVDEFNRAQVSPPDYAKIVAINTAPYKDGYFGEFKLNSDQGEVLADAEVKDNTLTLSGNLDMSKISLPAGTDGYTIAGITVIIHLNGQPFLVGAPVDLVTGAWSFDIPALKAGNYEVSMSLNLLSTNPAINPVTGAQFPNVSYEAKVTEPFYFKVVNPDVENLATTTSEILIDLVPDDLENLNIIGTKQSEVLSLAHLNFDKISGDAGLDTLKVENKLSIDLSLFNDAIDNIEIFDLNNTGSELKVTYADILKIGTQNNELLSQFDFADFGVEQDASIMLIQGSEHDLVSLDSILGHEQVKSIGKVENIVNHEFYDVYQVTNGGTSQQFAYLILDEQIQFNHF
ncbi:Ig-like domain-containing protein [Thorsellia anophelis]|uniref:Ig-like domain (Group 3) n=1 Tax=Thorsellia anophelis DSM 18579 TaxID=1123402 RepID=A0A1I0DIL1_9GAMM|nr:Ig-like domain-containing protein [Thorsellia anophelis]SET31614.1 Ig-like domain (group 3) [Thorsellia anophelis DSM 18579]